MLFYDVINAVKVISLLGGFAFSIVSLVRIYRADPAGSRLTLMWVAVYVLYSACGVGAVIATLDGPKPPQAAAGIALFLLAWILYGAVWLTRMVPKAAPLSPLLARFPGPADAVLATAALAGLGIAAAAPL
jgi:hypothetical protein